MELRKTKIPRGYRGILVMKEDHISCWIVMSLVFLNMIVSYPGGKINIYDRIVTEIRIL